MKAKLIALAIATPAIFVSRENPADKTTTAKFTDTKSDINRKDFGIVYLGKTDDLIRDEVVIELKLEAKSES